MDPSQPGDGALIDTSGAVQKALAVNLNPQQYGSIVEIGAGQETARYFFRAGGAAGTVAKTMSAYDMTFSDAIYGRAPGGRYVSRVRLGRMLDHEYGLLIERLQGRRETDTTFFAYAATVAAQGFKHRQECHGWLGVRIQLTPNGPANDIVLHVRMLDHDARGQQEALGVLGVNLIYGAFNHAGSPEKLIESLADDLSGGAAAGSDRIEIDMIEFSGPAFAECENRLLNLHLIRSWLTRAIMFDPDGHVVQPGEALRRKDVLAVRSNFRPVTRRHEDMFRAGLAAFGGDGEDVLPVAEMTMATVMEDDDHVDYADFLARVDTLTALGYHVLVSDYLRYFRLRAFLRRYTQGRIGIVARLENLQDIFSPEFYADLEGGILEAFGRLFCDQTSMYVYPGRAADGSLVTADNFEPDPAVHHIYRHLQEHGRILALPGTDPTVMDIDWRQVLPALRADAPGWAMQVPPVVTELIRNRGLFGFPRKEAE
ncbi:MAG: TonB-dependent receptor [Immundisolibacter sp.]|uniref:TonB-dependent receptor n=1 Tax=Immundisolibacter sp. TaxID=1934948 RepID=UPI003EE2FBCA